MTRDTLCSRKGCDCDADLTAGLRETASFARLPVDAPPEFRDLVEDIEDPRRVYAVHKASRRHNFQLLVQKYIVQLRDGCGEGGCRTPTCFTCRKRLVGKAPIRRYNTTSARTLAIYLASQDSPESGLCPSLKLPRSAPAAVDSLIFAAKHTGLTREERRLHAVKGQGGLSKVGVTKDLPGKIRIRSPSIHSERNQQDDATAPRQRHDTADASSHGPSLSLDLPDFVVTEKRVSKDYRSFAANMFGTVAFKMLEWLTPHAVEEMSERAHRLCDQSSRGSQPPSSRDTSRKPDTRSASPRSESRDSLKLRARASRRVSTALTDNASVAKREESDDTVDQDGQNTEPLDALRSGETRRNSNTRLRGIASNKTHRKLSFDGFPTEAIPDDLVPGVRSPRLSSIPGDKPCKASKLSNTGPRPISQLSSAGLFDTVSLEKMPPPKAIEVKSVPKPVRSGEAGNDATKNATRPCTTASPTPRPVTHTNSTPSVDPEIDVAYACLLPQALSRLDADIIDFISTVLEDDGLSEKHLLEPSKVKDSRLRILNQTRLLKRSADFQSTTHSTKEKLEWLRFVEQSLFSVLINPQSLIRSFTKQDLLYDSQTLWYCMLRLTRLAPSLVFHSLWMAAARLFVPLEGVRSPNARKPRVQQERGLSNAEAGMVLAICFHSLIAAAPLTDDSQQLYDMSRIRAHGLALAESGAIAKQPAELCLQYDDAFSNDFALRLARRVFAAISFRRHYDEAMEVSSPAERRERGDDVLDPLFAQLDFLNLDAVYILEFTLPERSMHETRVPTLLLDWARAVLLHDWDGKAEVPGDGPIGGALTLIETMYQRRQALLLGDQQFRSDYFAERLDEVEMPLSWLAFTSTRKRVHLLDFPFIFDPSTLVTYFRSINFSRMSRAFEESSSLQSRMSAIISPGSLIINPHHKSVLQDLLKTASSKYLIIRIGRKNVLRDAFDQLWRRERREFMRPLKVHLGEEAGEEGYDSGGVQQEFFRLAVAEALHPDYGAFTVDDRTRMTWFRPASPEPEWKFELIGLLFSLAVYNGLTLPVTFPKALYHKLLNNPVTELHHIADGWPDLASGLTTLLEWDEKDGAVEDIFARTYEFSVDMFDQAISREMNASASWPQFPKTAAEAAKAIPLKADNPEEAPLVTHQNRDSYVTDYIRYLTDVSVRPQYEAFARGFHACLHPKSLTLLNPALLQSIVEGVQEIDIVDLRRHTRYVGWEAHHRTIKDFWSIVKRYDEGTKRRLLEFVTASDRVPVGGMKNLQFTVQRNGIQDGEGGHLPTAYTCYGILLLPEYKNKEILRERLAMALENAQGFGFA